MVNSLLSISGALYQKHTVTKNTKASTYSNLIIEQT